MKTFTKILMILVVLALIAAGLYLGNQYRQSNKVVPVAEGPLSPDLIGTRMPTVFPTIPPSLPDTMQRAIAAEHGTSTSDLIVSVVKIDGNYAKGMVSEPGSGGLWFAVQKNGQWKLVTDGNGMIPCSDLKDYPDFPRDMIPTCLDSTQNIVTR